MASSPTKSECTICHIDKELYDEESALCEECYHNNKCCVCYNLLLSEKDVFKLFDNGEGCSCKSKLCKTCCDFLKSDKEIRCPTCRFTPNPLPEPKYIQCEEPIYNTDLLLQEINTLIPDKSYNNFYIENEGRNQNIKSFFLGKLFKYHNKIQFKYYAFRFEQTQNILEIQFCYTKPGVDYTDRGVDIEHYIFNYTDNDSIHIYDGEFHMSDSDKNIISSYQPSIIHSNMFDNIENLNQNIIISLFN